MNGHTTVSIQYYLTFNSDWLFACYFIIIFSLVATAVCYSSIVVSVTRIGLYWWKWKYAHVRMTGAFNISESTKTRLLNKRLKKISGEGA